MAAMPGREVQTRKGAALARPPFTVRSPYQHVKRGWYEINGVLHFFRSQDEALTAGFLTLTGWAWEYEPRTFEFPERGTHCYTPDFRAEKGGEWRWVEVKGWLNPKSRTQLRRFAKYYPEDARRLVLVTDWRGAQAWVEENLGEAAPYVEIWFLREVRKYGAGVVRRAE